MSVFIIPEKELQNLICGECGNYLSVLPVREDENKKYCGRCNKVGKTSNFQNKYKNGLFRCINRYDGCNKLLTFEQTVQHEEICKFASKSCPICPRFSCNTLSLILHFCEFHPNNILYSLKIEFSRMEDQKETYLYCSINELCFIHVTYEKSLNEMCFSTEILSLKQNVFNHQICIDKINAKKVFYKSKWTNKPLKVNLFNITKVQPRTISFKIVMHFYNTEPVLAFDIKQPSTKAQKSLKVAYTDKTTQTDNTREIPKVLKNKHIQTDTIIEVNTTKTMGLAKSQQNKEIQTKTINGVDLTKDFKINYPNYILSICGTALISSNNTRIELTCCNCNQFTGTNVFSCMKKLHITCWDCRAWCVNCNDRMAGYNAEMSTLNEVIAFPCRWNCGQNILGDLLRTHEKNCIQQPKIICPLCGVLYNVQGENHFDRHSTKLFKEWCFSIKNVQGVFFIHDFRIFMCRESKVGNVRTINIRPYGDFNLYMYLIINNKPFKIQPAQNLKFEENINNCNVQFILTKTNLTLT
ncbi:unnamed protein product [Brassicogethes aeneus]|uniref:E3 ubiquitin-protein ligase n=1 Tax=Brassicogethes aeneus TaxID=1431903 RepID=A0A9P0FJ76_BRAAE|nr:unnamed protein product [Brassicogethes aeneus]